MSIDFIKPEVDELRPRISVIGVGGAGGNAVANMIKRDVQGVDFIVANTDAQALNSSSADRRLQLGLKITQGLGAGSRPEIGRAAAEESMEDIVGSLDGSHMCFIAAGMGGGTGTGAAPVIAKAARDKGILTVGVVTKPFAFEGARRMRSAESGIDELQGHVDTLIVIPNQNLFRLANSDTTFKEAFEMADEVLQQGVRGITDLMVMPGLINLDFADVRSVMGEMGKAMMGTGEADGDNRAIEAAEKAISNPLLDGVSMKGARGVIISITGGEDMKLMEVDEAASHIKELVDDDANIIWGSAFNDALDGKIRVSVVATGIEAEAAAGDDTQGGKVFSFPPRGMTPATTTTTTTAAPTAPDVGEKSPDKKMALPSIEERDAAEKAEEEASTEVEAENDDDTLELTSEDEADELVLEDEDILTQPVSSAPVPPPADEDEGDDMVAEADDAPEEIEEVEQAAPKVAQGGGGGTLFERMSNIARGAAQADLDDEEKAPTIRREPLDIPRFLNRQNNQ